LAKYGGPYVDGTTYMNSGAEMEFLWKKKLIFAIKSNINKYIFHSFFHKNSISAPELFECNQTLLGDILT
jgi:hypothetical protein